MPDFSCYITITNSLDVSLTFVNDSANHGYFSTNPPQNISANSTGSFQLKDHTGMYVVENRGFCLGELTE